MRIQNPGSFRVAVNKYSTGKLPPGDPLWADFNDAFSNQELSIIDFANAIYTGHAYAAWHKGRRSLANFQCAQHIALDMDTGDERSDPDKLMQHAFVQAYAALIHSTPSSTPEAPRSRIVFVLDQCITSAESYQAAARFMVAMFPGADPACTDASRFFFGCKDCQIELPYKVLPLNHLRAFYRRLAGKLDLTPTQAPKTPQNGAQPATGHSVDVPPDNVAKIRDALSAIDPWGVDYNRWIGIIAALKRDLGDEGLSIAVQWANGKPGEVEREWDRLKVQRSNGVHVNTIFYLARKNGWRH